MNTTARNVPLDAVTTVRLHPWGFEEPLPDPLPGSVEPSSWRERRAREAAAREAQAATANRRAKVRAYVGKVFGLGTAASVASGMR
jgi:hypothetical protein